MRDIKSKHTLASDEYWPFIASVHVKGAGDTSQKIPEDMYQLNAEAIVQTWQRVAVLKVEPDIEVYFGFQVGDHMQFLNVPVETARGLFGARIGDGDVRFFVIPKDLRSRPSLTILDVVDIDSKKYAELSLY